ncbi:MAG: hypothetical protein ACE5KG_04710 [Nitrososphaerales archaeon]
MEPADRQHYKALVAFLLQEPHIEQKDDATTIHHRLIGAFSDAFAQVLEETPSENYIEASFQRPNGDVLRCIVLRPNGESPHALRKKAEKRLNCALEALRDIGHGEKAEVIETLYIGEEDDSHEGR